MTQDRIKITSAQVYRLRRLWHTEIGRFYYVRGDGKKGQEVTGIRHKDHKNDSSLPVLLRLGLIEFVSDEKKDAGKFYSVKLTELGELTRRQYQNEVLR